MKELLGKLFLIALVSTSISVGVMFVGKTPPQAATPTPQILYPDTRSVQNTDTDCGDVLLVSVHRVHINDIHPDYPFSTANQFKVLVFLTDAVDRTMFNYHVEPVPVAKNTIVKLGRFHAAIQIKNQTPVYVWLLVVDDDHFTSFEKFMTSAWNALVSHLGELGGNIVMPGSGSVAGFLASQPLSDFVDGLQKDDVVGEAAFTLLTQHDWGRGSHTFQSLNKAVDVDFSIDRYTGCQRQVEEANGPSVPEPNPLLKPARAQCNVGKPTQLSVGDMAVTIAYPFMFFREKPERTAAGIRYLPGNFLRLIEGPTCDGNTMFWKVVDRRGNIGWVAESYVNAETNENGYLLKPKGTAPH